MEKNRSRGIIIAVVVIAVILLVSGIAFSGVLSHQGPTVSTTSSTSTTTSSSTSTSTSHSSTGTPALISQTGSGLVVSDPLTSGNLANWTTQASSNAQYYSSSEGASGLNLTLQPPNNNQWAGYFAAQAVGSAHVYHALLNFPYSSISAGSFNMGLYVKPDITYPPNPGQVVNYVSCGVSVTPGGYVWQVVYGTGNITGATSTQTLNYTYNKPSLTQACTIITNGANLLTVYVGSTMVYTNSSMNLQISAPYTAYLEVEANSTQTLSGIFSDFYATLNNTIGVSNAPSGGSVQIVDSSNRMIANSTVGAGGIATISIPAYQDPPTGSIHVYDSSGKLVASTANAMTFWGGDAFSVG